jgi:hypothetical protein
MSSDSTGQEFDVDEVVHGQHTDGVVARSGAFPRNWVHQVRADIGRR